MHRSKFAGSLASCYLASLFGKTTLSVSMTEAIHNAVGCPTDRAIVQVLLYFEIFSYPLTAGEVYQFLNVPETSAAETKNRLRQMADRGQIFQFGSFFQSLNEPSWVSTRLQSNQRADKMLPVARRMAAFIGGFPFVCGVFVSGSLSKHCMQPDSDIDFFIITEPGRLWLARTLLVCFKKIFLFNSHKYFCINYFVDTEHLAIEEKNLFTATETATLLPMYGQDWYKSFSKANGWVRHFLPHFPPRETHATPPHRRGFFKRTLETLFSGRLSDWLDEQVMRLTVAYWKRKFRHLDDRAFEGALKSRRYLSKHHPLHFQQRVLRQYAERVAEVENREWFV